MLLRGINYDVGTSFRKDELSRPDFDEFIIRKEIEIIKNELRCNAIRISGHDIQRLSTASGFALEQGLQVWFSPAYPDATQQEAVDYLMNCAVAAEKLREKYDNIVFIVGCEYSLFLKGFIKGDSLNDRLQRIISPLGFILNIIGLRNNIYRKLNLFLENITETIKLNFKGKLTYASGTWEKVDWSLFDVVGIDHYRASYNKSFYTKQLTGYNKFNKPIAVLEFGCCAYKGAQDKGPNGWAITAAVNGRRVIKGNYLRDETIQASYITELLDILTQEKVFAAFVFTFVNPLYKYNNDSELDLDMASYGIVKPVDEPAYKELHWIPKEAFYRLADYYRKLSRIPTR